MSAAFALRSVPSTRPTVLRRLTGLALMLGTVFGLCIARNAVAAPATLTYGLRVRASSLVTGASHGRAQAVSVFRGPDGMIGVVIRVHSQGGRSAIVWATPDARALVVGELVNARGKDLNAKAQVAQGLRTDPTVILEAASEPASHGLGTPGKGPTLTFFIDPNCMYCHQLYAELMPHVADHQLRVRFVLVGVIKPDSPARAAAILAAAHPLAALAEDEGHFDRRREEGGFPIPPRSARSVAYAVAANNRLLDRSGAAGTPALFYCSQADHGAVHMISGVPADVPALIRDIAQGPSAACR